VVVRELLALFGDASGLRVNYTKTSATLIRAGDREKNLVANLLNCAITKFPIKYLGLQLALRPLTRAQWQPLLDATVHILPAWQRGLIARAGRLALVKAVLSARPIHQLLIMEAPCWLFDEVEKCFRGFFWSAKDRAFGGQCLVAWSQVCKPPEVGGLGIKDLRLQGLALRVRWGWLRRTDQSKPWQGLQVLFDAKARDVFDSLVQIQTGDGSRVLFWRDHWIDEKHALNFAPSIASKIKTRAFNSTTVAQAMTNNSWCLDLKGELSDLESAECVRLWIAVHATARDVAAEDVFRWPWSRSGVYTARSTYRMLTQGGVLHPLGTANWRNKATPKSKLFVWLAA
jgi:hypothetical protein